MGLRQERATLSTSLLRGAGFLWAPGVLNSPRSHPYPASSINSTPSSVHVRFPLLLLPSSPVPSAPPAHSERVDHREGAGETGEEG